MKEKTKKMKKIKEEVINCEKCPLFRLRKQKGYLPVIGEGDHNAEIMFIGEGPGSQEAQTGRPFVGKAGKILNKLLEHIDLERKDTYIANILKDRPPQNRDPKKEEVKACTPFLERQIEIIEPKVISPLGRVAMEFVMKNFSLEDKMKPISKIHGETFEMEDLFNNLKVVPLFHPAVATYNPNKIDTLKEDFEVLKKYA